MIQRTRPGKDLVATARPIAALGRRMKISLFLADAAHADAQSGKVHALGLGWRQCQTPTPPFALVVFLDIDWDETNERHELTCQLLTTDGEPVIVMGTQGPQPISFEAAAEARRTPGRIHGTSVRMPLTLNIPAECPGTRNLRVAGGGRRFRAGDGGQGVGCARCAPPAARIYLIGRVDAREALARQAVSSHRDPAAGHVTASSRRSRRRTRMLGNHRPDVGCLDLRRAIEQQPQDDHGLQARQRSADAEMRSLPKLMCPFASERSRRNSPGVSKWAGPGWPPPTTAAAASRRAGRRRPGWCRSAHAGSGRGTAARNAAFPR